MRTNIKNEVYNHKASSSLSSTVDTKTHRGILNILCPGSPKCVLKTGPQLSGTGVPSASGCSSDPNERNNDEKSRQMNEHRSSKQPDKQRPVDLMPSGLVDTSELKLIWVLWELILLSTYFNHQLQLPVPSSAFTKLSATDSIYMNRWKFKKN